MEPRRVAPHGTLAERKTAHPSLWGCDAKAPVAIRAGDTAWAPRCSAGRTAGSAGPRRRNAQLRWAMRGQDPLKEQRVPRRTSGLLAGRTPKPQVTGPA